MKKSHSNFSATEYSAQRELARIRNTFSFRFGLLVTESFVRKPWLLLFFPIRFIGLFFTKSEPHQIEYKNQNGPETYNQGPRPIGKGVMGQKRPRGYPRSGIRDPRSGIPRGRSPRHDGSTRYLSVTRYLTWLILSVRGV